MRFDKLLAIVADEPIFETGCCSPATGIRVTCSVSLAAVNLELRMFETARCLVASRLVCLFRGQQIGVLGVPDGPFVGESDFRGPAKIRKSPGLASLLGARLTHAAWRARPVP